MPTEPVTVAIFNSSEDTTDMLRELFEHAGFVVVSAYTHALRDGKTDLEGLMRQYDPQVIVYDIALPYEENWRLYQKIRSSPACRDVPFVLTSTNAAQVQKVASGEPLMELVGKPYDLDELLLTRYESRHAFPQQAVNVDSLITARMISTPRAKPRPERTPSGLTADDMFVFTAV